VRELENVVGGGAFHLKQQSGRGSREHSQQRDRTRSTPAAGILPPLPASWVAYCSRSWAQPSLKIMDEIERRTYRWICSERTVWNQTGSGGGIHDPAIHAESGKSRVVNDVRRRGGAKKVQLFGSDENRASKASSRGFPGNGSDRQSNLNQSTVENVPVRNCCLQD